MTIYWPDEPPGVLGVGDDLTGSEAVCGLSIEVADGFLLHGSFA